MKPAFCLVLFAIFLMACSPSASRVQQAIAQTQLMWTSIPTNTPYPTYTRFPTYTVYPTYTPKPLIRFEVTRVVWVTPIHTFTHQFTPTMTSTPMPTIPKIPEALDCSDIGKAHKESTTEERERVKTLLRGRVFYYTGTVNTVTEIDAVHLQGSLCHATLHHVPHEIAINLSKGQQIEGYGTILSIGEYLGEDIDLEANPDLIFVH
jgi:hypothetical protein